MARLITADEVKNSLNYVEKVVGLLTGNDEYKAAMLENQRVQTQMLSEITGVDMNSHVDPTNVDMDDLPEGLVGTAESSIESGDLGRAIFDIGGSKYEARVRAKEDVSDGETVVIKGGENNIRPSSNASNALSVMVGAGESGRNAIIDPESVGIYETDDLENSNGAGSIVLEPGDKKAIASTEDRSGPGYLLGVGAYNADDVEYAVRIDEEFILGDWTYSPLGTINNQFWLPREMGGAVSFSEKVEYMARRSDSAVDQAELTARLHTQEL